MSSGYPEEGRGIQVFALSAILVIVGGLAAYLGLREDARVASIDERFKQIPVKLVSASMDRHYWLKDLRVKFDGKLFDCNAERSAGTYIKCRPVAKESQYD